MEFALVPSRRCGTCHSCCVDLTIAAPELSKPAGALCPNCLIGLGCKIYAQRPPVCRDWYCGWRGLDWIAEGMRPDLSGVLICPTPDVPDGYEGDQGLEFALLTDDAIASPGLAEAMAHAIRANIATFLCVMGAAGKRGARMLLNNELTDAARAGNSARLTRELRQLRLYLRVMERETMHKDLHSFTAPVIEET